jgi:membrane protease YdiL (CAAX protease family)
MQGLRSWRSVLAIGGLMALLALVAVAAAGHAPSSGASQPSAAAPRLLKDYIATLGILSIPLGLLIIIWAMLMQRDYKDVPLKSKTQLHGVPPAYIAIAVLIALIAIGIRFADPNRQGPGPLPPRGTAEPEPTKATDPSDPYEPQFQWLPVILVGSLVLGIGGAMVLMSARRQRELLAATPISETVDEVLAETLDDLRREQDPRKAVIGAYAKMERTLAARGVPRRESEAPVEYLTRILDVVSASGHSVRRLTGLFARARYSPHEIDAKMKEDAIDALTGLRAELAAP